MTEPARTTPLQAVRPFVNALFNPITRRFIHWLPGFAIIAYRGRRSGKSYRTPINVFRDGEAFVVALTYGPDVQWVKNVLASGEAELHIRQRRIRLEQPVLFEDPTRRLMPAIVRFALGLMGVSYFLRMTPSAIEAEPARKVPSWVP